MRLMLKLLITTVLLSSSLVFAKGNVDASKEVIAHIKKAVKINPNFNLKDVRVRESRELAELPGWSVYFLDIDLEIKSQNNKAITVNDKVFTNGTYVVKDFLNIKTGSSLKEGMALPMDSSFYKKDRLLAGNFDAPNKVVIFSDPVCPYCQDYIPKVIKDIQKNPKKVALFYYHFPLEMIHKEAPALSKAMIVAQNQGVKDIVIKVYEKRFNLKTGDEQKILDAFNEAFGTKITIKEINAKDVITKYMQDMDSAGKMSISGTPTVYVNGKKDFSRQQYLQLIK